MQGGVGWQGIIPSRAAKMGSIAVDKGIAKVGGPADFYEQLEPDSIAEHILETSRDDIRELVERTMQREHPQLWNDLPPQIREAVHERVQRQLPEIVHEVTDEIGENIDQLLDVKLMVIRHIEAQPGAGQPDLPGGRRQGAEVHHQLRLLLRLRAGHPDRGDRAPPALLVGAADPRHDRRLGHQLAGDHDDLRADRAAEDRALDVAGAVPEAPAARPPTSTRRSSPTTS